jgi:hypothetical protein
MGEMREVPKFRESALVDFLSTRKLITIVAACSQRDCDCLIPDHSLLTIHDQYIAQIYVYRPTVGRLVKG